MDIKNKEMDRRLSENLVSPEELTEYLVKNHSVYEIANELAGYLIEDALYEANRIILTQAQDQLVERLWNKLVRLKRTDVGRKAKTEKYLKQNRGIDEGLFKD